MRRYLPFFLLLGSCGHAGSSWQSLVGLGGAGLALVASVAMGIISECQPDEEGKERYDRICGLLLLVTLLGFLAA